MQSPQNTQTSQDFTATHPSNFIPKTFLDAHDGTVVEFEPKSVAAWMPTESRYKHGRAEPVAATATANPQAGEIHPLEDGFLLEIEDSDPWAQDNEPISWTD